MIASSGGGGKGGPDLSVGTHAEAKIYAQARGLARAALTMVRANNQYYFSKATEMLPGLEKDYGITPGALDDLTTRRRRGAALEKLFAGGSVPSISSGLRTLLGSAFLGIRSLAPVETVVTPTVPFGSAKLNATNTGSPPKFLKLVDPVLQTGTPVWVTYTNLDATIAETRVTVGAQFMVQPENTALAELVTIAAIQGAGATRQFQATFTNVHDVGANVTNMDWPAQISTQRLLLIVVTAAASIDPNQRRLVDEFMAKAATGVTDWAIVQPTTPGALTIGPFTLGSSPLGAVPIGSLAFALSP
jgi:hypothetical protein